MECVVCKVGNFGPLLTYIFIRNKRWVKLTNHLQFKYDVMCVLSNYISLFCLNIFLCVSLNLYQIRLFHFLCQKIMNHIMLNFLDHAFGGRCQICSTPNIVTIYWCGWQYLQSYPMLWVHFFMKSKDWTL
jgi:hypothetical protein